MAKTNEFAARLRALRQQRGLSMQELADKIGVSAPSVFNWERGRQPRNKEHIQALADALIVPPGYLLSSSDEDTWGRQLDEAVRAAKQLLAERTGVHPDQIIVKIDLGREDA